MNQNIIDDIENFETEQEKKEKAKNMIKIELNLDKNKYILKLYLSEEKNSIIFKLEQEKTITYFYFEKYFLHDFHQKSRIFMLYYTITQILSNFKKILAKSEINLEQKDDNTINIIIRNKKEELEKYLLIFEVKKIILAQNQLNPKLVEQMQENQTIIEKLQNRITKLSKILQEKTDLINFCNTNITNINKTINEININNINNINNNLNFNNNKKEKEEEKNVSINTNKNEEKKEEKRDEKEKEDNNKTKNKENISPPKNINNNKEKEKANKEIEEKRYISNNRKKKNKKKNKKLKFFYADNQNKNNQNNNKSQEENSIFCFENVEVVGNKKIFELLVVFNVIMILIILCLIGSIYSIKSNLEYEKVLEDEFMNKLSYLNVLNDYGEDDYAQRMGMGDWDQSEFLFENDQQKAYFKEEIISRENNKIKDIDFILKYKSSRDGRDIETFYNNCKGVEDNLLLIRNERSQKFAILSKNIVEVLHGNKIKESQKNKKNFVMYNFNKHDIFEYNFTKNFKEIFNSLIKMIFGFFNEKGEFEDNQYFIGRILEIEIYELKYIK